MAYLLARERRLSVEYEKYGLGMQRAPDFTIHFREHILCNVEVTCLQTPALRIGWEAAAWHDLREARSAAGRGHQCAGARDTRARLPGGKCLTRHARGYILDEARGRAVPHPARLPQCARLSPASPAAERRTLALGQRSPSAAQGCGKNPGARHALPADLARLLMEDIPEGFSPDPPNV